jgi:hypothetical protein
MGKFVIDFFELCFLAEACIPPRPIARAMFWQSLTDIYWEEMTETERVRMFRWINKHSFYEESLEKEEDTQIFHARFDPTNQYSVTYTYQGSTDTIRAFLYKDKYHIKTTRYISAEYIQNISPLTIPHE